MKQLALIVLVLFVTITSCKQPTEELSISSSEQPIQFITSIQTRASVDSWQIGDTIGVFQIMSSESFRSAFRKNVPHVRSENSNTFLSVQSPLYYPKGEDWPYDFVAYYPYQADLIDNSIYSIELPVHANRKADLLYAKSESKTKTNVQIPLRFTHRLSYLQVVVEAGQGVESLDGLQISLTDVPVKGALDLSTNILTVRNDTIGTVYLKTDISQENTKLSVSKAVLLPADLEGKYLVFSHPLHGRFVYKFKMGDVIKEGKSYKFQTQLSKSGTIHGQLVESLDVSIDGWGEDNVLGETVEDNFNGIENDGSKTHPYTMAEAISLSQRDQLKDHDNIRGRLIGICTVDDGEFKSDFYRKEVSSDDMKKLLTEKYANRVMGVIYADDKEETDKRRMVVVTISTADDIAKWTKAARLLGGTANSEVRGTKAEQVSDFALHLISVNYTAR